MERVVGIDLGTTNSVIAFTDPDGVTEVLVDKGGDRIVPSVVYFSPGDDPVVGAAARPYAVLEPERVARLFKRGMGERTFLPDGQQFAVDGHVWSPEELSALVLRKLAAMGEQHFGRPVGAAVITVPAYFGDPERAATRSAGELAGLEVARIVNEPTAAAIAHGFDNVGEAGRLLVFDLGGGTFDVTIIDIGADGALEVVGTGGDRELGGADFDQLIYDEMVKAAAKAGMDITADPWTRQDAYAKAEDIKKELSTAPSATRPITAGGRPIAFTLERTRFERLLADHLRGVEDITLHTIEKAGLTPPDLTKVLMVGGSSRIPAFQELLSRVCGQPPSLSRNLDEDVARGAAILATKLSGEASPRSQLATMPVPVDVASHGIGVSALDEDTGILRNAVIMSGGTTVPASAEQTFFTVANNQTQIEVVLNEGDDDDLEFVRELGKSTARFRRPVPKDHPIRVSIEFTVEQIIRMRAFDGRDGTLLCEIEVQREGLLSSREKNQARQLLAKMEIK